MDFILNKPNFLGSEVGLVLKTVGVDAGPANGRTITVVDEVVNGFAHKIVPAGTLFEDGTYKGLIFQDIDVTGTTAETQKPAPLMIAGYYIAENLPSAVGDLSAQNLIAIEDRAVTRTVEAIEEE